MKLTSTANEVGFDAQRNRLRFFATSYSYSKHFIYAFNGRTKKKLPLFSREGFGKSDCNCNRNHFCPGEGKLPVVCCCEKWVWFSFLPWEEAKN